MSMRPSELQNMRQHTSACVSMRQHTQTTACVSIRKHQDTSAHVSAYPSIRRSVCHFFEAERASAYVSIRQHTYVSIRIRQHTCPFEEVVCHFLETERISLADILRYLVVFLLLHPLILLQLQEHTFAYVSIRQRTNSAYVSIRQHTSAYVSIRQLTSASVSIR
jgi:hypothetical protein